MGQHRTVQFCMTVEYVMQSAVQFWTSSIYMYGDRTADLHSKAPSTEQLSTKEQSTIQNSIVQYPIQALQCTLAVWYCTVLYVYTVLYGSSEPDMKMDENTLVTTQKVLIQKCVKELATNKGIGLYCIYSSHQVLKGMPLTTSITYPVLYYIRAWSLNLQVLF